MSLAPAPRPSISTTVGPPRFEPPGPGQWMLDTTHHGRRPVTRFMHAVSYGSGRDGFAAFTRRFGLPLETMRFELVNGYVYARPRPVGEPEKPGGEPPKPVLWLLSRLHPELRRRNKTARLVWETRRWREDVDNWFDRGGRREVVATNLRLQSFDIAAASDADLATHVEEVAAHLTEQFPLGFETHADIIPCGDFLAHCDRWGISAVEAAALLAGASPATRETAELLTPTARALAAARDQGRIPTSVDEVRALSPEANQAIDRWLDLHGWRLLNSDDVDCPTLAERPDLQLRVLLNLDADADADADAGLDVDADADVDVGFVSPGPEAVRARINPEHRDQFDRLLVEARYGLRLRDDNVGIRLNWPAGLARRALLEAGQRLVQRGALVEADHVVHAEPDELIALLRGRSADGAIPTGEEMAARHAERQGQLALDAPASLGPPEEPPPLDVFPAPLARVTAAALAFIAGMQGDEAGSTSAGSTSAGTLTGHGVGDARYVGRACVIAGPDDDFGRLEPGDVLIAPFTSPSFNSLFPLLGAVAVAEGGVLSHTAIVSREFGVAAVVGVDGLLESVRHGDQVEIDPRAGTVRVLA